MAGGMVAGQLALSSAANEDGVEREDPKGRLSESAADSPLNSPEVTERPCCCSDSAYFQRAFDREAAFFKARKLPTAEFLASILLA